MYTSNGLLHRNLLSDFSFDSSTHNVFDGGLWPSVMLVPADQVALADRVHANQAYKIVVNVSNEISCRLGCFF